MSKANSNSPGGAMKLLHKRAGIAQAPVTVSELPG